MALTRKRQAWLEEYLRCWNATEAARRVGYAHPNTQGPRLLLDVGIQEAIQERLTELKMSADEVLVRLSDMARADISEFITDYGAIDWDKVRKQGYLVKKVLHRRGENSQIELYDSQSALSLLGKHHRLFNERQENLNIDLSNLTDDQLQRIASGEDPVHVLATTESTGSD